MKRFFASLAFLTIPALSACGNNPQLPGYQIAILNDMNEAVPYEAFSENPVFPDGKSLQSPVQGTIPRGYSPISYAATDVDAERAGRELTNPFTADAATLERGHVVFQNFCQACHGATGEGDGPVILNPKPPYKMPNPPSYQSSRLKDMPDGRFFHVITYGRNTMPSHATQIAPSDRWKVILYIREMQKGAGS